MDRKNSITRCLYWTVLVTCFGSFQFGFHLGELNAIESVMSCQVSVPGQTPFEHTFWGKHNFTKCVPMSSGDFAAVTTLLSAGGLIGSLFGGHLANRFGRKMSTICNSVMYLAGSTTMLLANELVVLKIGRFVCGLAAGSCLVIAPMLINEVTPEVHRGFMGTMMQFSVSGGIMVSQGLSLFWADDEQWRNLFLFSTTTAMLTCMLTFSIVESPKWLVVSLKRYTDAELILVKIRGSQEEVETDMSHWRQLLEPNETSPLKPQLVRTHSRRGSIDLQSTVSAWKFATDYKHRKQAVAVVGIMTAAQLTGVNSITFYGVTILGSILPSSVLFINFLVSTLNCFCVGATSPLVDRLGRKPLLMISISLMMLASAAIALGITCSLKALASTAVFVFVTGYSIGLGPVPFLMVSELTMHNCVGAAQSLGTTLNWASSVLVSYFFPILLERMGGYVFFLFTIVSAAYLLFTVKLVPETKGKPDYNDVWKRY